MKPEMNRYPSFSQVRPPLLECDIRAPDRVLPLRWQQSAASPRIPINPENSSFAALGVLLAALTLTSGGDQSAKFLHELNILKACRPEALDLDELEREKHT